MQVSVTPIDLVAIHNTLVSLSTCFTLNHFRYSFPLIFKLQVLFFYLFIYFP